VSKSSTSTIEEEATPAIEAVYKIRVKALAPDHKVITNPRDYNSTTGSFVPENLTISIVP